MPLSDQTPTQSSEDEYWDAVVRRDSTADGRFYYSVRTTGVYCRPSCSSRQARRENVAFHATHEAAEAAGFRPCKRCLPNQPELAQRRAAAITRACHLIESSELMPKLDDLAAAAGMSRSHFDRVFKSMIGLRPKAYAQGQRTKRVREELTVSPSITDAIYGAGFNSSGHFYAAASRSLGMTPTNFRSGGSGATVRFAVGDCSLGAILVAATDKGVCAIFLGDDPEALISELEGIFPNATLIAGDEEYERWIARIVGFVEAPALGLDLPLDVRGTAFQQRVWHALRAIPPGSTATYSEIADRIGAPQAARAVARACASNQVAVAIPCHRIVRKDGTLSGYRWGVERKRALLARESRPLDATEPS